MIYMVTQTIVREGTYTLGVYSTRELAEKALNEYTGGDSDIMDIIERQIDQSCYFFYCL